MTARPGRPATESLPGWVEAWAPGKINLLLYVDERQPDGYHDLLTVFQAIDLGESVRVRQSNEFRVITRGHDADKAPTDAGNLALRAVKAVAEIGQVPGCAHVEIIKRVPVAGGMAGGSADAAAALVAADALWELHLGRAALHRIAARLGADVPFCLSGGTAIGTGRGDRLAPVIARAQYHWVAAVQDEGLPTPQVFAQYDQMVAGRETPPPLRRFADPQAHLDQLLEGLRSSDPSRLAPTLYNALQAPALRLRPHLSRVLSAFRDAGAAAALVSGSGPTVVALAREERDCPRLADAAMATGLVAQTPQFTSTHLGAHVTEATPPPLIPLSHYF